MRRVRLWFQEGNIHVLQEQDARRCGDADPGRRRGGCARGGPANAATPSCGHRCVNVFSKKFSDFLTTKPGFVLDVLRQGAKVGQPIIMFQSSNADPAEDFTVSLQGYGQGLRRPPGSRAHSALAVHYGDDIACELEYSPNGVDSGLCVGIASHAPSNDQGVTLQPCGVSAKTVWIMDVQNIQRGGAFTFPFVPLINGADTNFSHPFVLTYPQNG